MSDYHRMKDTVRELDKLVEKYGQKNEQFQM